MDAQQHLAESTTNPAGAGEASSTGDVNPIRLAANCLTGRSGNYSGYAGRVVELEVMEIEERR